MKRMNEEMKQKAKQMAEEILTVECTRIAKLMEILTNDTPTEIVYLRMCLLEKMTISIKDSAKKKLPEDSTTVLDMLDNCALVARTKEEAEAFQNSGAKVITSSDEKTLGG